MTAPQLRVIPGGSTSAEATDAQLLRAFEDGDRDAFGRLVARHQAAVLQVVRRYAASPEDARDLVQRAFLRAFEASRRSLPRFLGGEPLPFKAWLLRLAVNLGKNHARDTGRWAAAPLEALDAEASKGAGAHGQLERAQQEARLKRAVLELPRRQREVFSLRVDAGLPFAEVAAALGITEGNAKAHFHHALKRLRALCAEEAGT